MQEIYTESGSTEVQSNTILQNSDAFDSRTLVGWDSYLDLQMSTRPNAIYE